MIGYRLAGSRSCWAGGASRCIYWTILGDSERFMAHHSFINLYLHYIAIPTTCAALLLFGFVIGLRPNSYGLIVAMVFQRPIRQGVELLMLESCRPTDNRQRGLKRQQQQSV